jgi:hypothetical protein
MWGKRAIEVVGVGTPNTVQVSVTLDPQLISSEVAVNSTIRGGDIAE